MNLSLQGSEGLPSGTASENTTADRTSSHTPSNVQMTPSGDLDKTHRHVHHTATHQFGDGEDAEKHGRPLRGSSGPTGGREQL